MPAPGDFVRALWRIWEAHGVLFVVDNVLTRLGRSERLFCGGA